MFTDLVDYVTRDVRPFMDLLALKGQLVNPVPVNDNAANDNVVEHVSIVPPEAAA